jgi:hypothetical protein
MIELTSSYASLDDARLTVTQLQAEGFPRDSIDLESIAGDNRNATVTVRPPLGMSREATEILQRRRPVHYTVRQARHRGVSVELISLLSGPVSPGAISGLSGPVSPGSIRKLSGSVTPGAIRKLSGPVSPGAIRTLSGPKSPGAIATLSGPKSPGAISRLSRPKPVGAISRLSAGWYFSELFGLPLLVRDDLRNEVAAFSR